MKTGWKSCLQYQVSHFYEAPSGARIERVINTYAPTERMAITASQVVFIDILRKLGIQGF